MKPKERSASQSHFNDLCALLDVPDPISADPEGEWFVFEKGARKTVGGGDASPESLPTTTLVRCASCKRAAGAYSWNCPSKVSVLF